MIEFEKIKITCQDKIILKCKNISVEEGEFVAVVGPSGVGKSTLLNFLSGFIRKKGENSRQLGVIRNVFADGVVRINGKDISNYPAKERNIAVLYQQDNIYPHMTVNENICFPFKQIKMSRSEQVNECQKLMDIVSLDRAKLNQRARSLSGGEKQRLALAKLFARSAKIYLLDEPFSHLDPILREGLRTTLISRLSDQKTTLLVTHDWEDLKIANKVVLITKYDEFSNSDNVLVINRRDILGNKIEKKGLSLEQINWMNAIEEHF